MVAVNFGGAQVFDIREIEPGALKGLVRIQGMDFHAYFVRVKYDGILGEENEAGHGEQKPWDDDPASLCNVLWNEVVIHLDECVFKTIEVPRFEGAWVLYIWPGAR